MSAPISADGPAPVPIPALDSDATSKEAGEGSAGQADRRRVRGKRGGKQHRKRVVTDGQGRGRSSGPKSRVPSIRAPANPQPAAVGTASPAGGGNGDNPASSAQQHSSPPAVGVHETDDVSMCNPKKRRRAHRRAKRNPDLKYADMTVAQKLRFDAKQARRRLNDAAVKVPTDKRGRIKKGIHLLDYQPNAPRHTLPTTGDLRVDLSSSSGDDDSDEDLDEIIGAASATIPLTRLESNVTSEAGGSLARRDSIDTLNDSDLDFGSDLPEYTGEEFQSGDFGTSDVTDGQPVESATVEQLRALVSQLRTVKREMHDRLKAAELEAVHLRRKLEAVVQKLRNLRAKTKKEQQQRRAAKAAKTKPQQPT